MILPNDTLACDSTRLASWQNNPDFDYNRELVMPEVSLMDWISSWFERMMRVIFGNEFAEEYSNIIFIAIFIIAILLILWFLYKKRPELFMRSKKKLALPYTVHEDDIHGVDFDSEIAHALSRNDYKSAIRFLYLQTLKYLSDHNLIDWQLYKTPTEYIYEIKSDSKRLPLRELTNRFLRVRYGNFEANKLLFDEVLSYQQSIQEGGEP